MRLFLLAALPLIAADPRGMTIEKYLDLKTVSAPKLSPDGNWVVYSTSEWNREKNKRDAHLHLVPARGGESIQLTNGEKGESGAVWSPDSKSIAFLADRGPAEPAKGAQAWVIRLAGGEAKQITKEDSAVSHLTWSPDGKSLAYVVKDPPADKAAREKRKKEKFDAVVVEQDLEFKHLWIVEIESGKKRRLTNGAFSVSAPRFSPDGTRIAFVQSPEGTNGSAYRDITGDRRTDIYVVPATGGDAKQITNSPAGDTDPQWSPDGGSIAYVSRDDPKSWAAKADIYVVPATGGAPRNLTKDWNESASDPMWNGDQIRFAGGMSFYGHLYAVPIKGGAVKQVTSGDRLLTQFDSAADRVVYAASGPKQTDDIYIADIDGKNERRLTIANPALDSIALGETETVKWQAPDGLAVEGLLVKPIGYEAGRKYPLVLLVHGGPHSRWAAGLTQLRTAQIYAAEGYATLLANPRGSTGYGTKFMQANNADWGGKDFQDLMAGVDAMIARGVADPAKLAVAGGSYGGFMTFWTITQSNRFKAAIGHAGISDWYSFYGQSDIPGLMEYGFGGHAWTEADRFRKYSPITYVEKVTTPILITHGEEDRRVAIAQAEQYYRALKLRGVDTQFVRYPREGHGITEPNHQIDQFERHLGWLKRHIGN